MSEKKPIVGVLASHDYDPINNTLAQLLDSLRKTNHALLGRFRFAVTGGTYQRVIEGVDFPRVKPVDDQTRKHLLDESGVLRLPSRLEGGVTVLAYLVVRGKVSIIWPLLTPLTSHWLNPENLALMRLCDQLNVKRLMNTGSILEWFFKEADLDKTRNPQEWPLDLELRGGNTRIQSTPMSRASYKVERPIGTDCPRSTGDMTIALIAHDGLKDQMKKFASDFQQELAQFKGILATGTTGQVVEEAAPRLKDRVFKYNSGPKGGDIQIATEVLYGGCDVVVFFVDPLRPHPHIEDIRVVFGACMIHDGVRMLTNEMQAREWMERVVRTTRV